LNEVWPSESPDTSSIKLPEGLSELADRLAEYTHDAWARERIRMGWSYGPERSNERKQTPLLVPYDALPEEEKQYDRLIVEELIKGLIICGYEIRPISEP
jgi:ryanodine receptor 2